MRASARILMILVLGIAVVACGDDTAEEAGTTTTTSDPTTTTTSTTSDPGAGTTTRTAGDGTTTTTAPADEGTEMLGEPSTGTVTSEGFPGATEMTHVVNVRLGAHEGFERVVFEFTDGVPSHEVTYVDPPITEAGSGREVDVEGSAYLSVSMSPASGFDLSGDEPEQVYEGPDRLAIASASVIVEAVETGDFEAMLTWVVGTEAEAPFAVTTLEDPARLVVDIAEP